MTYLEIVNDVMARLRESSVASPTATTYSTLIAKYVNDSKRQIENAWNWEALYQTIPITTVASTHLYTITGSGKTQKDVTVFDATNRVQLKNVPLEWILKQQQLTTVQTGPAFYYAWAGNNGTDSKVELFPTPNGVATINFNMYVPQVDLSASGDVCLVDGVAVALGAYARAIVERGEDGGIASSEAGALMKTHVNDLISLEAGRNMKYGEWCAV